jgi:pilus assembly protein CpaD
VRAFAELWKARGYGTLGVSSEGPGASEPALREIRGILSTAHVGEDAIRFNSLQSGVAGRPATVSLTFMTDMAVAESCDDNWTENMGEEPRNLALRDFACAHQQNLAALIEDPRDLLQPRQQDPSDAMRRGTVLDKYRKGEPTAAQTESSQEGGEVSNVAKE